MNSENKLKQETIVNHLKNYGFVYPGSEIYGGLSNTWDYGPVGVLLKNNIKHLWWKEYVTKQGNSVGLDSSIILNPQVWKASGHLTNFSDPLIDCKQCRNRFRVDKIKKKKLNIHVSEGATFEELEKIIKMAGFEEVEVIAKPVSKEYEERWGRSLAIGEYIMSSAITARKPL